tara:strand:+ start:5040 stop:5174 length:135 start_codon:yes stop_codon:yes gene_type:complete
MLTTATETSSEESLTINSTVADTSGIEIAKENGACPGKMGLGLP